MIEVDVSDVSPDVSRVRRAGESIRAMADEMAEGLQPAAETLSVRLRRATIQAPMHSLAIAFLLGLLLARRR
jgi:hypothetical protein